MKEQIRLEVMKVFDQEADVDTVVDNILRLFSVVGQSEQLHVENSCKCEGKDTFNRLQCTKCKPL